jgi:hypothetical protein
MTISVVAQYSDSSGFLNSLTPTVSVILPDGTSVSSGSATFIANGLYQYTFTVNYDVQYIWQFEESTLSFDEKYVTGSFMIPSSGSSSGTLTPQAIRNAMLLSPKGVAQNGSVDEQLTFLKRALYIIDRIAKKLGIIS